MFRHIFGFEWRYQVKSPVFAVGSALFFLFTFGSVVVDEIRIGARGNVHVNSPSAILETTIIMSLFAVFVMVAMVSSTVIRDDETGFAPILRTTSVSKGAYLSGRFLGATFAALLVISSVPLAILIGSAMPWLDPEKVGPLHVTHYLYAIFVIALPTLLIVSAALFALATATRSMMWTYVAAVAMLVLYVITRGLLRDPRHDTLAALSDPFALSAVASATKYWTASERNTRLPEMTGLLLYNRLIWGSLSAIFFAVAYRVFRFETRGKSLSKKETASDSAPPEPTKITKDQSVSGGSRLFALARFDMAFVFRSPAFFVLLGIGALNSLGALWFAGDFYGTAAYPATRLLTSALNSAFTLMPMIIAVYYSGELVWRDRDRKTHEIIDATSAPDWAFLAPKILAISLVLASTAVVATLMAIVVQLLRGGAPVDLLGYLSWFVWPMTVSAILLAVLSVFVQVLVPQKFIGWGVMLLFIVSQVALASAGFEHKLYNYGDSPAVPLSDMNRSGRFWIGQAWLHAYWTAFAVVLTSIAYGLWRRGVTVALRPRLRQIPQRLKGPALVIFLLGLASFIGIGAFVYYNTNVLNHYETSPQRDDRLADMEKALLPFKSVPQPLITNVELDVDLYPREVRAVTKGTFLLENRTGAAVSEIHVRWAERLRIDSVQFTAVSTSQKIAAAVKEEWPRFHYRIYKLEQPMEPFQKIALAFTTTLEEKGFPNSGPLTRIVENGSFLDNDEISPRIGMSEDGLLRDRSKRRKHGLPEDLRLPSLEDESGRARNTLRPDSAWVTAKITIRTDPDQTPIAPGEVVSEGIENNRKVVTFQTTDSAINHFFSIQSGRYAVLRDRWYNVNLAVYYHPAHAYNVDRMIGTMKTSLDVFSSRFSKFQFKQARILEFPSYADFAQSFANTIPYSENIGFLLRMSDPEKIDMVTYITAHEMGHQWWGHQLLPSEQQGATMLVESLAQYSALLVMEKTYGKDQVRRFLKYELDRYLRSRGGEVVEEVPLYRVENQPYIHYQKGGLVFYWLRDAVGEEVLDGALAELLEQHAFRTAPYPNTLDFLKILRAKAGPAHEQIITDLFEKITLLDAKTIKATSKKRPDGKYDVTLDIEAHKLYADGKGQETEAPLDEPFDIGLFDAEPGTKEFTKDSVLFFERRPVRTGAQQITLTVDKPPHFAGVDPYNKRIDRNSDDNTKPVDGE